MRHAKALLPREAAAHRMQMLATIGRRLRETYDVTQPLPDHLSDLVREIEQLERTPGTEPCQSSHLAGGSSNTSSGLGRS